MIQSFSFSRQCRRFLAVTLVAVAIVPAGLTGAFAQSSNGGGGRGGGGGGGGNGDGGGNAVLECLGADCINVRMQTDCPPGATYCQPKPPLRIVRETDCSDDRFDFPRRDDSCRWEID